MSVSTVTPPRFVAECERIHSRQSDYLGVNHALSNWVNSSDEGLLLAYEVRHGIDSAAGVEDYISRLEHNVLHVQLNELLFTC